MTIHEETKPVSIPVFKMRDGEISVITDWNPPHHVGEIVQRYQNSLITLGKHSVESWSDITVFDCLEEYRVRILPPGTLLKI